MRRRLLLELARWAVLLAALVFVLVPAIWIVSAAFSTSGGLSVGRLVPEQVSFENFERVFTDPINPFVTWTLNSLKVATLTSVLAVLITAFSAYGFSRFRFLFRRSLLLGVLLIQVFPSSLTMVALFLLVQQIGTYIPSLGLNSHGALVLVYIGAQMGINIWLMKGFFDTVPREIDESAHVDGATHWQVFWRLIMPLVRPILTVVGIIVFIGSFGEFVLARVLLQSTEELTLMVGLFLFISEPTTAKWGIFAAGSLLAALPIVTVYLLLQDTIVGGLTQGSVKG
jgi:ABC-type maltose transport system permease subunit